ncbi:hypothetical protein [Pseudomonas laurentiana]
MTQPTNITATQLYQAIATFGPLVTAELGYFHGLAPRASGTIVEQVQVVAPTETFLGFPPHYGHTLLDLTPYNLPEVFTLTGTVVNGVADVRYTVDFQQVSQESCIVHVSSSGLPEETTLDVIASVCIAI